MNSKKKFEFKETLGEPGSEVIGTIISVKKTTMILEQY